MQRLLTNAQASEIRDLHHASGWSVPQLREKFLPDTSSAVGRAIIRQILTGETYKDASGEIGIVPFKPKDKPKSTRKPKLSPAQKLEIIEAHESGKSQGDIMRKLAQEGIIVSRAYISRIVNGTR